MENIDKAYQDFLALSEEIQQYSKTIYSEQDTRIKVIDRILIEVLGWPYEEISTEDQAGQGFIDYKLTINGLARLIIEAKRDGRELGTKNRGTGRAYKLSGPVFKSDNTKEGVEQAIRYCGHKNAELACVTNGREWIIFRGSRLGDGLDTMAGMAFVFSDMKALTEKFQLFYDLLAYDSVQEYRFRAYFQEAEGQPVRAHNFRKTLTKNYRVLTRSKLAKDLDRVMTSFFRRLTGDADPDMLAQCFVVTKESQLAEEKLARISEELITRIHELETEKAEALTELIRRVKSTQRNEFVLLIGTKGSGKSTFVDRFFHLSLPPDLADQCVVIRVNLADSQGDEANVVQWLNQHLLEIAEQTVFQGRSPSFDELQGMFFDEYQRWSTGTYKHLYEKDKEQFKIEFGKHIEER